MQLSTVLYVVEIILGLGILVFVHELGHFLMAKLHKVRVEAFSLGFPPNIFARKWGETEYRIGVIPLGGYVKMAGEAVGEGKGDPDELTSKPAWARIQIFAAGALINLAVAFPIAIIACLVGRYVHYPQVAAPSLAEARGGMRPGDTILNVDGRKIETAEQFRQAIIRRTKGSEVLVGVRHADGREEILKIKQGGSEGHRSGMLETQLYGVKEGSPAHAAGLRTGDQVVEVDGRLSFTIFDFFEAIKATGNEGAKAKTTTVTVVRPSEGWKKITVTLTPAVAAEPEWTWPIDERLLEPVVGTVAEGSGAFGILQKGDVIRKINDVEVRTRRDLGAMIEPRGGETVKVVFARGTAVENRDIFVGFRDDGKGALGISVLPTKRVAEVAADSPYSGLLQGGDVLKSIELDDPGRKATKEELEDAGASGGDFGVAFIWSNAKGRVRRAFPGSAMMVRVERLPEPLRIEARKRQVGDIEALGIEPVESQNEFFRKWKGMEAVRDGLWEPIDMIGLTFQLLYKLISGQESTKGLAGPVGIFQASYRSAEKHHGNFFWILILITVNLGVFNLLPIPVLDGGHVLLLLIEKLRGRPNSVRFVEMFQLSGLLLLLALVVFVTFNDITR